MKNNKLYIETLLYSDRSNFRCLKESFRCTSLEAFENNIKKM